LAHMAVRERPSAGRIDAHGHGRVKPRQAVRLLD